MRTRRAASLLAALVAVAVPSLAARPPVLAPPLTSKRVDAMLEWLKTAEEGLLADGYRILKGDGGGWTAPNERSGLRTVWHGGRVELRHRVEVHDAWTYTIRWLRVGREQAELRDLGVPADESVARQELTWGRRGVRERYVNAPWGFEGHLEVFEPPDGASPSRVTIEASVDGLVVLHRAETADAPWVLGFLEDNGEKTPALELRLVAAKDAHDRPVPAELAVASDGLAVKLDDSKATYPIDVTWSAFTSGTALEPALGHHFSRISAAAAGDFNGDGLRDVALGCDACDYGIPRQGAVAVYLGREDGTLADIPDWRASGKVPLARFGVAIASAGDTNGDGFDDLLVGAPWTTGRTADDGRVFLFQGSPHGFAAEPSWTATGGVEASGFGYHVAGAGDVNGDGFDDMLITAPFFGTKDKPAQGRVSLFLGAKGGASTSPSWTVDGAGGGARQGLWGGAAGDVNGDGLADFMTLAEVLKPRARSSRILSLYLGAPGTPAASPAWTMDEGRTAGGSPGAIGVLGDFDGDGLGDVAMATNVEPAKPGPWQPGDVRLLRWNVETGLSPASAINISDLGNMMAVTALGVAEVDGRRGLLVGATTRDDSMIRFYPNVGGGLAAKPAWTRACWTPSWSAVGALGDPPAGHASRNRAPRIRQPVSRP